MFANHIQYTFNNRSASTHRLQQLPNTSTTHIYNIYTTQIYNLCITTHIQRHVQLSYNMSSTYLQQIYNDIYTTYLVQLTHSNIYILCATCIHHLYNIYTTPIQRLYNVYNNISTTHMYHIYYVYTTSIQQSIHNKLHNNMYTTTRLQQHIYDIEPTYTTSLHIYTTHVQTI